MTCTLPSVCSRCGDESEVGHASGANRNGALGGIDLTASLATKYARGHAVEAESAAAVGDCLRDDTAVGGAKFE